MLGRDGRIRAGDLQHPMQARWLLRYVPIQMAGVMGLAPTSSTVTGWILVSSNSRPQIGSRSWSRTKCLRTAKSTASKAVALLIELATRKTGAFSHRLESGQGNAPCALVAGRLALAAAAVRLLGRRTKLG